MKKHFKTSAFLAAALVSTALTSGTALADDHAKTGVWGDDQSVSEGTVTAKKVITEKNGWLVVHRTDEAMKPGPVVGHAPLKKGKNMDVAAILTEEVAAGDMLMLMIHSEDGGMKTGVFEYTLGAKEDGPIRMDGKLVMATITAK
ncbi:MULTISPECIES: DUF7282 domain-containing protein [Marinobacter]|uniref:DUF7282 domain-containing protein n=1 Tax=Marinobacter profundi TaxID=2666256 RepID=A0A2G1UGK5_9GAMM|nr:MULTISPECIES: hypothetical protein [Marinobacter]MBD3655885.1 hypothetical protein [Marinobacter sp.]PHQ13623.1 hypothetical protein CLH61_17505 [Marinobacter profundi]